MQNVIAVLLFVVSSVVFGAENLPTVAQHVEWARSSTSLKVWAERQKKFIGANSHGYRMYAQKDLCDTMRSVGMGCSYNDRGDLVQYLFAHGVDLFPCEGGTNPYTRDMCGRSSLYYGNEGFYNFIGQPVQNSKLKRSIEKNRGLFTNGDLSASAARQWKK